MSLVSNTKYLLLPSHSLALSLVSSFAWLPASASRWTLLAPTKKERNLCGWCCVDSLEEFRLLATSLPLPRLVFTVGNTFDNILTIRFPSEMQLRLLSSLPCLQESLPFGCWMKHGVGLMPSPLSFALLEFFSLPNLFGSFLTAYTFLTIVWTIANSSWSLLRVYRLLWISCSLPRLYLRQKGWPIRFDLRSHQLHLHLHHGYQHFPEYVLSFILKLFFHPPNTVIISRLL